LCHYQFKLTLKWYAKKYGKVLIDVNESYTSKTDWKGNIHENLKAETKITVDGIELDRDLNGARNIYIKQLSLILLK
jgi:transposase